MKLIDADILIKKCKEISEDEWNQRVAPACWACAYEEFADELENADEVGGWISVKDRLPDKSGTYLCYQPKAASICALNTVRWSEVKGWMGKEVGSRIEGIEYWMPLPEPPKEEQ